MVEEDSFADEMARELDATIRMLAEQESALAEVLGPERIKELEEYLTGRLDGSPEQERAEFDRWLDSRDSEWLSVASHLQRAALGHLCMRLDIGGRQAG